MTKSQNILAILMTYLKSAKNFYQNLYIRKFPNLPYMSC